MDRPSPPPAWAEELIVQALASHNARTLEAYTYDLREFARFVGQEPAGAAAQLLGHGPAAARRLVTEYAAELRRRGRAPTTVDRRLALLARLARAAYERGLTTWELEIPDADEIADAVTMDANRDVPYLVPPHPSEIDRLDLQHYALRGVIGANHMAPVRAPTRILDVGSGTGLWGFETCEEFPGSLVVGLDLVPSGQGGPPGYRCVRGNILHGLPFGPHAFDFVHQRLLFLAIPVSAWPAVVADLVRVMRPGGWIELVETPFMGFVGGGPAIERLRGLVVEAAAPRGLDTAGTVFRTLDGYLRDAGAVGVNRREFVLPVGEWGGQVGSLMATDCRAAFTRLLQAMGGLSAEESGDLLRQVQEEYEERRVTTSVAVAFGRKPGR